MGEYQTILSSYPRILYLGELEQGKNCYKRGVSFSHLGHEVRLLDFIESYPSNKWVRRFTARIQRGAWIKKLNERIVATALDFRPSLLWFDKALYVRKSTLETIKNALPDSVLIHYNPDDPFRKETTWIWRTFMESLPCYDLHFVPDEIKIHDHIQAGAKNVLDYDRSYDPRSHRPMELDEDELSRYGCKVGFIGSYAPQRSKSIAYLIEHGIEVAVFGNGWKSSPEWPMIKDNFRGGSLFGDEYAKVISAMEIALHFLRHENRDQQDSRTFEIPACGTFMLAEWSAKHEKFFEAGKEADFFSNNEELLQKVRYYLSHPERVNAIAKAGRRKSVEAGYDHENRLKELLRRMHHQLHIGV